MSYHDYRVGQEIVVDDPSFAAIIQAAMRKAGGDNLDILKAGWPNIWRDLQARYEAPGGLLPGEVIR